MKTIPVERIVEELTPSGDYVVPANSSRLFMSGLLDVNMALRAVRVSGRHPTMQPSDSPLRVTEVHIVDLDVDDGIHRVYPVDRDGQIRGVRELGACESFLMRVENGSSEPWTARPVAVGMSTPSTEEVFSPMMPRPDVTKSRRIAVPANKGAIDFSFTFPCACALRRITARSDSDFDVVFHTLQIANCSLIVSGRPLPVEFFRDGWESKGARRVTAANSLRGRFINTGKQDRYVEIDLGVDSVDSESTREGRANSN